jgi:hypothetical protein
MQSNKQPERDPRYANGTRSVERYEVPPVPLVPGDEGTFQPVTDTVQTTSRALQLYVLTVVVLAVGVIAWSLS